MYTNILQQKKIQTKKSTSLLALICHIAYNNKTHKTKSANHMHITVFMQYTGGKQAPASEEITWYGIAVSSHAKAEV